MARRVNKKWTRRTKVKLTPKEADEIIRQEFTDSQCNKHTFIMDLRPHQISRPTIEGTVKYKDKAE